MDRLRAFSFGLVAAFAVAATPSIAAARLAPESGSSGSASFSTKNGGSAKGNGKKFEWPELVVSGNAISFLAPLQIGIAGYLPKARFAFQYDRQIRKSHWIHVGAAFVADRGGFENFRMDSCGLENAAGANPSGACDKGGVFGFDLYAGYDYKFYLEKHPYVVPIVRGSVGFSYFALPKVGGGDADREQSRTHSWTLNIRPGGGVRVFPWSQLGFGADVNLPLGFLVHTDLPIAGSEDKQGGFLFGVEILPLVVEYRF
jgi:hypothetical protein